MCLLICLLFIWCDGFVLHRRTRHQINHGIGKNGAIVERSARVTTLIIGNVFKSRINLRRKENFFSSSPYNDLHQDEEVYYSPNVEIPRTIDGRQVKTDESSVGTVSSSLNGSFNEYSFFDEAVIYVRSGSGGQGSSTFKKGANGQNAQPDGGNGGRGGDVYLIADGSLNTLAGLNNAWRPNSFGGSGAVASSEARDIRPLSFRAENGEDGGRQFTNGRFGKEIKILVPPGTLIQEEVDIKKVDTGTGEEIVIGTRLLDIGTVELSDNQSVLLVAKGGDGGEGNGAQSKYGRGVRRPRAPSIGGVKKRLKLTLKIVADIALVGVPNGMCFFSFRLFRF